MIERYFIEQGMKKIKLEEYFKNELDRAGFTGMKIQKTPLATKITLRVAKPGLAIGKKGKTIRTITEEIAEKFGIENPELEIQQIEKPELDAQAMVDRIITLLARGYSWRSVAYKSIEDIMQAGAQGVELIFKGKLAGKSGRKKKERLAKGYMKKAGEQSSLVDYAHGTAYPKVGAIGVKLRIIKPDVVFPDKKKIEDIIEEKKRGKTEEKKEEKTETTEKEEPEKETTEPEKTQEKEKTQEPESKEKTEKKENKKKEKSEKEAKKTEKEKKASAKKETEKKEQ
ncbi:MAG: 30S ribosomal protein S3 [Candidatus Diapherotrites archaeon]